MGWYLYIYIYRYCVVYFPSLGHLVSSLHELSRAGAVPSSLHDASRAVACLLFLETASIVFVNLKVKGSIGVVRNFGLATRRSIPLYDYYVTNY